MIRRLFTIGFLAIAFWAGMRLQQARTAEACAQAGGTLRGDVLCIAGAP